MIIIVINNNDDNNKNSSNLKLNTKLSYLAMKI